MHRPIHAWIALAALWAGTATAAIPSQSTATGDVGPPAAQAQGRLDFETAMIDQARTLAARGDARSLLAAALIVPIHWDDASGQPLPGAVDPALWFDAARHARPADPLVAWLEASGCPIAARSCDPAAAVTRLLQVDGDNAAVQWLAINAAVNGGDAIAARTHLRLAAQAPRFEPYAGELLALLLDARNAAPVAPMDAGTAKSLGANRQLGSTAGNGDLIASESMAQWAAHAIPALAGVAELCQLGADAPTRDAALRQDCTRLLAHAAGEDSMLVYPGLALPALVELTRGAERAGWQAQLRDFAWLYEQAARLLAGGGAAAPVGLAGYAAWIAADGELGAMRRWMEHDGIALDPPADWLPRNPRYRALITTGRAPTG